ncbi:MAG: hypothetical protein AAF531_25105 [Actinomycetota bacterium]
MNGIGSLDERANQARRSITEATGSITDREFDPPGRSFGTIAAVVFAALLGAGGLFAIWQDDGPQAADIAADGPDAVSATEDETADEPEPEEEVVEDVFEAPTPPVDPPPVAAGAYLVFDSAPEGFEPLVFDMADAMSEAQVPTFDVYGSSDSDNPFADGDLLVGSVSLAAGEDMVTDPDSPTIEVDGQTVNLEEDEFFSVVSWQEGTEGVGLLSHSLTQDELVEIMTGIIRTGEVDSRGLTLLEERVAFTEARIRFFGPVVFYQLADWDGLWADASGEAVITGILINSEPVEASLLTQWFGQAETNDQVVPVETIEHNGVSIETGRSIEGGRFLRFDVDGVPIEVTMLAEPGPAAINDVLTTPAIEDALALLGDIRGATEAEIETMRTRGGSFGS